MPNIIYENAELLVRVDDYGRMFVVNKSTKKQAELAADPAWDFQLRMLPELWDL